jgi:tocopherol cyclase
VDGIRMLVHGKKKVSTMNEGSDISRDAFMLKGKFAHCGYDWWWHSFTAHDALTNEEKGFFIEFFLVNPSLGQAKPVFGQLPENKEKGNRPSYLMVKVGAWGSNAKQLNRFFGWGETKVSKKVPFSVEAGDCSLSETATKGHVEISEENAKSHPEWFSDAGSLSWDLKIHKLIPFNVGYGAGDVSRALEAFQMYWHAEGMKTAYEGEIVLDGRRYLVRPEDSYGYADKNWGADFTSPWLWLASSNLKSKISGKTLLNSAFDIGGGRPKIGTLALDRKLLGLFNYEGQRFEFNFSKFWTHTKTVFSFKEEEDRVVWHVDQKTREAEMVTDVVCLKKDMIFIRYESPKGLMLHKHLFNGGNGMGTISLYSIKGKKKTLIDEIEAKNIGCEYGEYAKE